MRLLLTATKLTVCNTYFDVSYRKYFFSQIDLLKEAWCVNMFSSYMVSTNEEYVKDRCLSLGENTGKENDRPGKEDERKRMKKKDEERLKGQEKKENRKYFHFIFNLFDHYTVLISTF